MGIYSIGKHTGFAFLLVLTFAGAAHTEGFKPTDMCPTIASYDGIIGSANQIARVAAIETEDPVRLNAFALELPKGSSAAAEIGKAGFAPDQSNLALVGYMNPQIKDISNIPENATIFLPKIETFDGKSWKDYASPNPIDGFAIDYRYIPRVVRSFTEEQTKTLAALDGIIDDLQGQEDQKALQTFENVYRQLQTPTIGSTRFSQSIGMVDASLSLVDRNLGIAEALVAASRESGSLDEGQFAWADVLMAAQPQSGGGRAIKVTLRTLEPGGKEIDGLKMRYMSGGAFKIKCDRKYAATFARDSLNASQVLKRAAWYFWAENPSDKRRTKPVFIDLTTVEGAEFTSNYTLEWE